VAWRVRISKPVQKAIRYFVSDPDVSRDDGVWFLNRLYEALESCPDKLRGPDRRIPGDPTSFLIIRPLMIGQVRHYFRFAVNDTDEPGTLLVLRVHHEQRRNPDP
jgi:hypothetical protein